jgi:Concanavalin A-like lectin/glucanases superfamily/Bacterial TSP3 repeat
MKTVNYIKLNYQLLRLIIPAILLCSLAGAAYAQFLPPGGGGGGPTNAPLDSWTFYDHTNWTDDASNAPISFTNITSSYLGDGNSLVVSTNVPAWLNYNIYEPSTGATNLVVNAPGSITFWYAPANWSSADTNAGGTGPGDWAQLIDVGEWTTNASYGYWGMSVDPGGTNIYFVAQDGSGDTYVLSSPISWTTNYFHFVALTYSATNVSLYLDGQLATNDPGGLSIWPGSEVVSNGVFFGSDTNGLMEAQGLFNTIATYNYPLDSNDVQTIFNWYYPYYMISPWNMAMDIVSAPSNPSTNIVTPDVITGAGYLQWDGAVTPVYSTNAYQVWITNITATAAGSGTMNVTFTIQGGQAGYYYDVFATGALQSPLTNAVWFWMGQGNSANTYTLPITSANAFIILGTPLDSDGDGLTDAYELLVSHTDPHNPDSNLDGILDGWDALLGLNPHNNNVATQHTTYSYTPADWLNEVTGVKSGNINLDPEGNVTQVSQ